MATLATPSFPTTFDLGPKAGRRKDSAPARIEHIEYSPSNQATCRICKKRILEGTLRICALNSYGSRAQGFTHLSCYTPRQMVRSISELAGVSQLQVEDKEVVITRLKSCNRWWPNDWQPSTAAEKWTIEEARLQTDSLVRLRLRLKRRGLSTSGNKVELIRRILSDEKRRNPWTDEDAVRMIELEKLRRETVTEWALDGSLTVFDVLPDEILVTIVSHLNLTDIATISRVCRHFHEIANDDFLWKQLYFYSWGPPEPAFQGFGPCSSFFFPASQLFDHFDLQQSPLPDEQDEAEDGDEHGAKRRRISGPEAARRCSCGGIEGESMNPTAWATGLLGYHPAVHWVTHWFSTTQQTDSSIATVSFAPFFFPPMVAGAAHPIGPIVLLDNAVLPCTPVELVHGEESGSESQETESETEPETCETETETETEQGAESPLPDVGLSAKRKRETRTPITWKDRYRERHLRASASTFRWSPESLRCLASLGQSRRFSRDHVERVLKRLSLAELREACRIYELSKEPPCKAALALRLADAMQRGVITNFDAIIGQARL